MVRPEVDSQPGVTIVVPTLNRGTYLLNTLRDLASQNHLPLEILVVDQSDTADPELEEIIVSCAGCIRHHRVTFRSLPMARNFGWQRASFDIIVFVDDDIRCGPELVHEHVQSLQKEGVGIVAGGIREEGVAWRDIERVGRFNRWTASPSRGFDFEGEVDVDHAGGGNFAGIRSVIEQAGGFDEALGVGAAIYEETELGLRVKQLGFRIRFNGRARVDHLAAGSGGCREPDIEAYVWALAHNRAVLIRRHVSPVFWPTALARLMLLGLSFSVEYRQPRAIWKCLIGCLKGWRRGADPPLCTDFSAATEQS